MMYLLIADNRVLIPIDTDPSFSKYQSSDHVWCPMIKFHAVRCLLYVVYSPMSDNVVRCRTFLIWHILLGLYCTT